MPKSNLEAETRACIDSFTQELTQLVQRAALESALAALGGAAAPVKRGPGRPRKTATAPAAKKAPRRKKGGRRTSADVDSTVAAAAAHIRSNPGCSVGDIGAALSLSTKELRLPLMKLLADGKIKTTGQKRGTRYHAGSGRVARKKAAMKRAGGAKKKAARKKAKRKTVRRKKKTSRKP